MIASYRAKISCLLLLIAVGGAGLAPVSALPASRNPSMPTIRQQFVDKLTLRLARISVANGFQTDIGASLQTDYARDCADNPSNIDEVEVREQTLFAIYDRDNDVNQDYAREGLVSNVMPIQVRIYHARQTTAAELRTMIGDVEKAVSENEDTGEYDPQWRTWDQAAGAYVKCAELAIDTRPTRSGFVRPQNAFAIEAGAVEFTVEYLTQPFNAYE